MKKYSGILSVLILTALLLCSCGKLVPEENITSPTDAPVITPNTSVGEEEDILLTFCAMSDVHMGATNTEETLNRALGYLTALNVKPEVYLFAGDLTDATGKTGTVSQIIQFKNIYEKYEDPSRLFYCLGPTHDVPEKASAESGRTLFYNRLGQEYFVNDIQPETVMMEYGIRHMEVKGYHFFGIDWDGANGGALSPAAQNWLKTQLREAAEDPDKPIFVITHVPDVTSIDAVLLLFPQVVCFTGHSHNSAAREDSITQDKKYTRIHCGGMHDYRVNGYERYNEDPYLDLGNVYEFGHAIYVQVDKNNNVTVTRLDVYNGVPLNEKWVIGPDRRDVYTKTRIDAVEKCFFTEEARLDIRVIGEDQLMVSWDACKSGGGGPPIYYQIQLLANSGNGEYKVVEHKELSSRQVFFPNDEGIPSLYYSYTFKGLDCLSDYAVVVTAQDCWNTSGNALVYTNGTYE